MILKLNFQISNVIDVYYNGFIMVEITGVAMEMATVVLVTVLRKNLSIVPMLESRVMLQQQLPQHQPPVQQLPVQQPVQQRVQYQQLLQQVLLLPPQHVMDIHVFLQKKPFLILMHSIRALLLLTNTQQVAQKAALKVNKDQFVSSHATKTSLSNGKIQIFHHKSKEHQSLARVEENGFQKHPSNAPIHVPR